MRMQDYEFWFVVGSQFLYGPEVLKPWPTVPPR